MMQSSTSTKKAADSFGRALDYLSSLAFALDSGTLSVEEVRELFGDGALTEAGFDSGAHPRGVTVQGTNAGSFAPSEAGAPPPKDKPVTLVFGGSFNPVHVGHVQAILDARSYMQKLGYTVERTLVVPTAARLLKAKLGDDALSLEERAQMVRFSLEDHQGIEVTTEPSVEAESYAGKLRRTQLADWTAAHYPGTTVVNVTGADAAPGHPPAFPSVYQGDVGSKHEGYYYLAVPREDPQPGQRYTSSSTIRKYLGQHVPIPEDVMHPKAAAHMAQLIAQRHALALQWLHESEAELPQKT